MNHPQYDESSDTPSDEQKTLSEENKRLQESLQRLGADFSNYQKRVLKERESWSDSVVSEMILKLLPALDCLDMLTHQCKDKLWSGGIRLVGKEFLKALGEYDVTKIAPQEGDTFDSNIHCCISVLPEPIENEIVAFVIRSGYLRGSTVIRAADVVVRKNTQKSV